MVLMNPQGSGRPASSMATTALVVVWSICRRASAGGATTSTLSIWRAASATLSHCLRSLRQKTCCDRSASAGSSVISAFMAPSARMENVMYVRTVRKSLRTILGAISAIAFQRSRGHVRGSLLFTKNMLR